MHIEVLLIAIVLVITLFQPPSQGGASLVQDSPPYTFFLLNGDMELNRNR